VSRERSAQWAEAQVPQPNLGTKNFFTQQFKNTSSDFIAGFKIAQNLLDEIIFRSRISLLLVHLSWTYWSESAAPLVNLQNIF